MENQFNVLERIEELRMARGWSIYKLAYEAELTQSTISNMFARKSNPSISTLCQICNAFGITLSDFFNLKENKNSTDEQILISSYRKLNKKEKEMIITLLESLTNKS